MKMYKGFMYKLMFAVSLFIAAILWLLSVIIPKPFDFFNFKWAIAIVCGITGVTHLLGGVFGKNAPSKKTGDLFWGLILIVIATTAIGFALPKKLIFPIIAVIITFSIILSVIGVRGKRWDGGDNEAGDYKTYREREAEKETEEEIERLKAEREEKRRK